MLELDRVGLVYNQGTVNEVIALRGLDLHVPTGQFVTVVGTNGAGKSSLVQAIAGAVRPTFGTVSIAGKDVSRVPDYRRAAYVARVFDNPHAGTAPELSIEDNMALAMARGRRRTLRFALNNKRRSLMKDRLAHLGLGLENRLSDAVQLLSAGQRQSLTMVMAGLCHPEVLLLDEHLAALDPGTQKRVLGLTLDLVQEFGCTTIMITHNMEHAITVGDRLIVMSRGRIVADYDEATKQTLTVDQIIAAITRAGDSLSDSALLGEAV
jgi:putative tryptophan/tyrosine transport system ATP-binding protein